VVDNSARMRQILRAFLEKQDCVEIVGVASDGAEALELAESLRPDLVLMDIQMPRMNGLEATAQLRRHYPRVRVIVITGLDGAEPKAAALASGAHGFVAKSRLSGDLLAEIRRIFPQPGQPPW
jgi:NarL family two-component system response regulator LiaR